MIRWLTLALLALPFSHAQPQTAQPQTPEPTPTTQLVHCGWLLDRPGQAPREKVTLWIEDGRVVRITDGFAKADGPVVHDLRSAFVTPGWIDCHTHITGQMSKDRRLKRVTQSDADAALAGAVFARRTIEAGFTVIRNVGSAGDACFALRDAIARGEHVGPRILAAGQTITPSGGHGDDTHGYRDDLFEIPGADWGIADGPAECRKAVRLQVKRGADVIKFTATGGVLSVTNAGTSQQFFEDEVKAIVDTAHSLGRKVAAHAHGADGIAAALRAGVDSIEHGSYLDEESIALFQESGAYLVPTLLAGATVVELAQAPGYFAPAVRAKALAVGPVMRASLKRAYDQGVRIAFGTDSGVSVHGTNAREFDLMVEAGMPPMACLHAATVAAADLCGLSETHGTLEPGKQADLVALGSNPLDSIEAVHDVRFVMKAGQAISLTGR